LCAQDEGKTSIPLDHFYAKPIHGATALRKILKDFHFGLYSGLGKTYFNGKDGKGHVINIPLAATLHYEFDRYRIGAGYSYELMGMGSLSSNTTGEKINPTGHIRKYWGMAGVSFYRWNDYLFTGDLQVGSYKMKVNYNSSQVVTSTFFNFGVTAERNLSEYFKVFVRPYYEIKSCNLMPSGGQSIHYNINGLYATVGFTYSIPELPRCFLRDCHAQINHAHGNKEYRSRRHPIYKKQNPGYGENDPVLLKYKGKNKKKLDPY
ncbi:MAG TPA: hypothetical protein DGG95_05355, partial [Cytophagales bacterium]|nr:hypothetical protein [Cytophagales bacterium]